MPKSAASQPLFLYSTTVSDVGTVRANNQDSSFAGEHLIAMCDGMGGHAGGDTASSIRTLAGSLALALDKGLTRPANFYGVGGMKIFRDLIYVMRGLMKADHKFYKEHGIYDFPQKQKKRILQMQLVGALIAIPSVQKKMKGQMSQYIIGPYEKVVRQAKEKRG